MSKILENEFNPDYISPPGDTLQDILDEKGMTQIELSKRTGRKTKTINQIIKGIAPITPETAIQLERTLGVPASFWNNREKLYREKLAQIEEEEKLKKYTGCLNELPVKSMIQHGWIKKFKDPSQQVQEVFKFYGIASYEQYENIIPEFTHFRKAKAFKSDINAVVAWLRKGELEAHQIRTPDYNKKKFKDNLLEIRNITTEEPKFFIPKMKELCRQSGVALVFIPELPETRVCGSARWLNPKKALIQLSLRYKTNDHLWFNFFHEAGHIILHGKRNVFIDDTLIGGDKEEEANEFAANFLIPYEEIKKFALSNKKKTEDIIDFARKMNIAPGIVVGQLQHYKYCPMSHYNKLKQTIDWSDI